MALALLTLLSSFLLVILCLQPLLSSLCFWRFSRFIPFAPVWRLVDGDILTHAHFSRMQKVVYVVGGAGCTGRIVSRMLLQHCAHTHVVLVGRTAAALQELQASLGAISPNVSHVIADASSVDTLLPKLQGAAPAASAATKRTMIVCSSYVGTAPLETAIQLHSNYIDIQFNAKKYPNLQKFTTKIAREGITCLTEGGFHPGTVGPFLQRAAAQLPGITKCSMGCILRADWRAFSMRDETVDEFVAEMLHSVYRKFEDGCWVDCRVTSSSTLFPMTFSITSSGKQERLVPLYLGEMGDVVARLPSLRDFKFGVAGFGPFIDFVLGPAIYLTSFVVPRSVTRRMMIGGLRRFASLPPYVTLVRCEAEGPTGVYHAELFHPDGYELTAAAVVAAYKQIDEGLIPEGVFARMGSACDHSHMFEDMQKMGMKFSEQTMPICAT